MYIYIYIHVYTYIYIYIYTHTHLSLSLSLYIYIYIHVCLYGQFSELHVCVCGLDPDNLKFETVRTHKQHICF